MRIDRATQITRIAASNPPLFFYDPEILIVVSSKSLFWYEVVLIAVMFGIVAYVIPFNYALQLVKLR